MKKISIGLIFVMCMLLATACMVNSPGATQDLEGVTWFLQTFDDRSPLVGTSVTLQFEAGQISGTSGCNHYGGSYQVKGESISFSDIYATEMYCADPPGVMEQEQSYLAALGDADRYSLTSSLLTLFTGQQPKLIFTTQPVTPAPVVELTSTIPDESMVVMRTSTPPPLVDTPTSIPATPLGDMLTSTPPPLVDPPDDFIEYQDNLTGISINMPETWLVTGIVDGQYAIFQSYPEDKYIGGEGLKPGDTKCDLNIRPEGIDMAGYLQQLEASPTVTVISEQEIRLQSGILGRRLEIDSMGLSVLFVAELNHRTVVLSCFGDFTRVDEIAITLSAMD
jgi:heat shock protein HslJ